MCAFVFVIRIYLKVSDKETNGMNGSSEKKVDTKQRKPFCRHMSSIREGNKHLDGSIRCPRFLLLTQSMLQGERNPIFYQICHQSTQRSRSGCARRRRCVASRSAPSVTTRLKPSREPRGNSSIAARTPLQWIRFHWVFCDTASECAPANAKWNYEARTVSSALHCIDRRKRRRTERKLH